MPEDSFEDFYQLLQKYYQNGEYAEALEQATRGLDLYPQNHTVLDYWRMTMAARTGNEGLVIGVLQDALDRGDWYSEVLLRRSPSFKPLQGHPQFERLIALNQEVAEIDQERTFPMFILRSEGLCVSGGPVCPLLLGLHSNAATAHDSLAFWAPVAASGWLVAAPQSSQAIWRGAYVWDNRELAEAEIQKHFATLRQTYAVDPLQTVVGGHSMGGEVAIWLALRNAIEMRGFLAIGPGGQLMDDLDEWERLLESNLPPGLRGAIIFGREDASIPQENIHKLVDRLNEAGIPCQLEVIPGIGHEHTLDYDPAVLRGLQFIVSDDIE